eukprot:jgi/Phyca11/21131/fgenesh1_pg.PHYCAscaffold_83_\
MTKTRGALTKAVQDELAVVLAQLSDSEMEGSFKTVLLAARAKRDAATRRLSLRKRSSRKVLAESQQEEREPDSEDTDAGEPEPTPITVFRMPMKANDPRTARVKLLRGLLRPDPKTGAKRKRSFNEVMWGDIRSAYVVDNKKLKFKPTLVPLPEEDLKLMLAQVKKRQRLITLRDGKIQMSITAYPNVG